MSKDPDSKKGAVAQDSPDQKTNTSMEGQNPHRGKDELLQGRDSDMPEPGENEEHSMEGHTQHSRFGGRPEETSQDRKNSGRALSGQDDPGHRQKMNQNDKKEDPLAS